MLTNTPQTVSKKNVPRKNMAQAGIELDTCSLSVENRTITLHGHPVTEWWKNIITSCDLKYKIADIMGWRDTLNE